MHDYAFKHTRTGDFRLNYHMVWTTGFNRTVLHGKVGEYLLAQIRTQCEKLNVVVEEIYLTHDSCVDLILTLPTDVAVSQVLKNVKGLSAQYTMMKYPELKDQCWNGKLWNGQSMVETIGAAKKLTRKRYIKNQERGTSLARDLQTNQELQNWWNVKK